VKKGGPVVPVASRTSFERNARTAEQWVYLDGLTTVLRDIHGAYDGAALVIGPEGLTWDDFEIAPSSMFEALFTSDDFDDPAELRLSARSDVAAARVLAALAANPDWCARHATKLLERAQQSFRKADELEVA
jgi:hypothetical protein